MNAYLPHPESALQPEPARLELPEATRARLRSRLAEPGSARHVWDASFRYGVCYRDLAELVGQWQDQLQRPSWRLELPCFSTTAGGQLVRFLLARSTRRAALPLLLLHGYTGSLAELGALAPALNDAGCDVVVPALPGFGSSHGSVSAFAGACAALMRRLGYNRYAVHGSDLGASVALALAAADRAHVAALHVSQVPTYPGPEAADWASLTAAEKSKLARLSELHEQLRAQLPTSPVEELAFALSRLDEPDMTGARLRQALLESATLSYAFGDAARRAALYRASGLAPAPPSGVPIAVEERPLGAPSLRRFAERAHRIVSWREHDRGGPAPALEDPTALCQALVAFCERLR